jgi:predicted nucleic acid-binding protein
MSKPELVSNGGAPGRIWYLDSSVALRILLGLSAGAMWWYDQCATAGERVVSSRLLELEMTRVFRREGLDVAEVAEFVGQLVLLHVDDALVAEASAIRPHLQSLDALHLASAQRIGAGHVTVVTHEAGLAKVADLLGFDTFDPVV